MKNAEEAKVTQQVQELCTRRPIAYTYIQMHISLYIFKNAAAIQRA